MEKRWWRASISLEGERGGRREGGKKRMGNEN